MFRQLLTRGSRFMYLSMLILTLSPAVLFSSSGTASAQTFDPTIDPNCQLLSAGMYECKDMVILSTYDRDPVITLEPCTLGWSSRKANQEVTTIVTRGLRQTLTQEYYSYDGGLTWYALYYPPKQTLDYVTVNTTVEYGECRPVTGRPPQN